MSVHRETLSACLIVQNEENVLPDALASVAFCDEIIVVDGGSTDESRAVAEGAGATVVGNRWPGFAAQRNFAAGCASSDWILEIDADERVSPELAAEIGRFLREPPPAGVDMAAMPRRHVFLGRKLGSSARYPDYRHRLFRRGAYLHDEDRPVHEGLVPSAPVWALEGELVHHLADGWREAVEDAVRYARLEASHLGKPSSAFAFIAGAILRPAAKLVVRLFVFRGWRDGWRGFAKVGIDCGSDSLVWILSLRGRQGGRGSGDAHFSPPMLTTGRPRLLALASPRDVPTAAAWLGAAASAGADVALITPSGRSAVGVRVRWVKRLSSLHILRALDAEWQLCPYDELVSFGSAAALIVRMLPRRLRGAGRKGLATFNPSDLVAQLSSEKGKSPERELANGQRAPTLP